MPLSQSHYSFDDRNNEFFDTPEGAELVGREETARLEKQQAEREKAIKKADAQLHKLITLIGKETQKQPWLTFMENFLKLNRDGELRGGVKKRFLEAVKLGPFDDIRFRVGNEFGIRISPVYKRGNGTELGQKTKLSRAEIDKRREANRATRLAKQPTKGATGSKSEPGSGKKDKGGKKK